MTMMIKKVMMILLVTNQGKLKLQGEIKLPMRIVRNSMVINNCKKKIAFRAETNKNNMRVIKNSTMILQEQNQNLLHLMMTQQIMM